MNLDNKCHTIFMINTLNCLQSRLNSEFLLWLLFFSLSSSIKLQEAFTVYEPSRFIKIRQDKVGSTSLISVKVLVRFHVKTKLCFGFLFSAFMLQNHVNTLKYSPMLPQLFYFCAQGIPKCNLCWIFEFTNICKKKLSYCHCVKI